jgi:hypothetical protein
MVERSDSVEWVRKMATVDMQVGATVTFGLSFVLFFSALLIQKLSPNGWLKLALGIICAVFVSTGVWGAGVHPLRKKLLAELATREKFEGVFLTLRDMLTQEAVDEHLSTLALLAHSRNREVIRAQQKVLDQKGSLLQEIKGVRKAESHFSIFAKNFYDACAAAELTHREVRKNTEGKYSYKLYLSSEQLAKPL